MKTNRFARNDDGGAYAPQRVNYDDWGNDDDDDDSTMRQKEAASSSSQLHPFDLCLMAELCVQMHTTNNKRTNTPHIIQIKNTIHPKHQSSEDYDYFFDPARALNIDHYAWIAHIDCNLGRAIRLRDRFDGERLSVVFFPLSVCLCIGGKKC